MEKKEVKSINERQMDSIHSKQKAAQRNRFAITSVVLGTFFLIMFGIGYAIIGHSDAPRVDQEWKEILLLVLGAFLGSYSRIIDFWFNTKDDDGVPGWSEPQSGGSSYCSDCGNQVMYNRNSNSNNQSSFGGNDMPEEW